MNINKADERLIQNAIGSLWIKRSDKIKDKFKGNKRAEEICHRLYKWSHRIALVGKEMFNAAVPTPPSEIKKKQSHHKKKRIFNEYLDNNNPIALVDKEGLVWIRTSNFDEFYQRGRVSKRITADQLKDYTVIMPGSNIPEEPKSVIVKEIIIPKKKEKTSIDPNAFNDLQYEDLE